MVSKATSQGTSSASIGYAIGKNEAEILDKNLVMGDKAKDIKAEFETFQDLNGRCKANSISIVISPAREDGKELTKGELRDISKEYMQRMKLDKHQYVVGLHKDTKTPHIHIIANRINHRGEAYKDDFIGRKSWNLTNEMAKERGLVVANEVATEKTVNLEQTLNQKENLRLMREQIRQIFHQSVKKKPKDFDTYKKLMEDNAKKMKKTLEIKPYINKQGKFQGYSIVYEGNKFKASDINRKMTLKNLMSTDKAPAKALASNALKTTNPPLAIADKLIKAVKVVSKTISKGGIGY